ncbi:hypothetical protein BA700_10985 [Corynebacterium stationis]|nr:hypothetical protein BA700_10985 [Corynebacterium stationis]
MIAPQDGQIRLDGQSLYSRPTKEVAREVGLLLQGPVESDGIRVIDLVSRGRYPHQSLFKPWMPRGLGNCQAGVSMNSPVASANASGWR